MPVILVDDDDLHVARYAEDVWVTLMYPPRSTTDNNGKRAMRVVVDQSSVRASDGIRVSYDYNRDGYIIEQNTGILDDRDNPVWVESAFLLAWARNAEQNDE